MRLSLRHALALLVCLAVAGGVSAGTPVVQDASAAKLSKKRAVKAAYKLARRVAKAEGAVYAVAGYCKRRSARRVNCWAGIVWANGYGAAQRVSVVKRGGKVRARRFGRVYRGYVGGRDSGESESEWAVCGIRSSVCVGS